MTWPIDVNQSPSTATPVLAQWIQEQSVQGHSDGSCTKVKPYGRTFSKANLASEHYCLIPSLSRLKKAESPVWHHSLGPASHLVANWYIEFLHLIKGSNLSSVEQTLCIRISLLSSIIFSQKHQPLGPLNALLTVIESQTLFMTKKLIYCAMCGNKLIPLGFTDLISYPIT